MTTRNLNNGFTLAELLVAISVLALLVLFVSRLADSAAAITTLGHKKIDADSQARQLLGRMVVDFAQMVRRSDIDYYLKSSSNIQSGNDQIAFYSSVPGYYPATGSQSSVSLVAYRISAQNKLERMSKGLVWNGVSAANSPIVFLPLTISSTWPAATTTTPDIDYELVGPQIFRFEYAYLLNDGTLSETPWATSAGHFNVNGMQDVTSIIVSIALIDSKSRTLISDSQLSTLLGNMPDFAPSMNPGDLVVQWQSVIDSTTGLPRPALQGIRCYERYFRLLK